MVMPPPRSRSAGMRSIRRELQRRRSKLTPTKSAVAKKLSVQPAREDRIDAPRKRSSTISHPRSAAAAAPQPVPISRTPLPRSTTSSAGSTCRPTPAAAVHVRPGTLVGVRTKTTKLKTGQVLVLWLKAMIVSRTDDGYEVVYDGNWPPGDPYGTVHVARDHVRLIKTSPSPLTTPPPSVPPSTTATRKEMLPDDEPRPTTAGKKLRLIRNLALEMEG